MELGGTSSPGTVVKKVVSDVKFKGYIHHATKEELQYFFKSDKTDHVAIHKGPFEQA
jgi:Hypervirulence associated proteins TUDOR domain